MIRNIQTIADSTAPILANPMLPVGAVSLKRFISFSGGVESTTMCILYGKGATAIWCDTGAEHDEMYKRIDDCEKALKEIHKGDFELVRLKADVKVKGSWVDNLIDAILGWKFMPSQGQRWCTGKFKIAPIDNFLSEQGECELLIGLNADEETREGNWGLKANVKYVYQLQEDGLTRDDCIELLNQYGLNPDFPLYMSRGGCFMCIYKSIAEYKAMYIFDRKTFDKVWAIELKIQDKRKKLFTISVSGKSMTWIAAEVEREIQGWGLDSVKGFYKQIEQKQACGAFCHR
jgi:hypothetical protein